MASQVVSGKSIAAAVRGIQKKGLLDETGIASDKVAEALMLFLKDYHFESLTNALARELGAREENTETIMVRLAPGTDLTATEQQRLATLFGEAEIKTIIDQRLGVGYQAFYQNKLFDATVDRSADKLNYHLRQTA